jgi:hypothetical protein
MFTNSEMYPSFFDSARCAAWAAIKELREDSSGDFIILRRTSKKKERILLN